MIANWTIAQACARRQAQALTRPRPSSRVSFTATFIVVIIDRTILLAEYLSFIFFFTHFSLRSRHSPLATQKRVRRSDTLIQLNGGAQSLLFATLESTKMDKCEIDGRTSTIYYNEKRNKYVLMRATGPGQRSGSSIFMRSSARDKMPRISINWLALSCIDTKTWREMSFVAPAPASDHCFVNKWNGTHGPR